MIWVLIALMLLATVVAVALPVLRARGQTSSTAEHDLSVFTDQLKELDRDHVRGLIGKDEYESARAEVGRRILAAERDAEMAQPARGASGSNLTAALVVLVLVPLIAGPLYVWRGNPGVGSSEPAARGAPAPAEAQQAAGLADAVEGLKQRLAANPQDFDGWVLLGRSYIVTQQPLLAIEAYGKAVALRPGEAAVQSFLGEAIVFSTDGVVTERARVAFEQSLAADASDPAARFYLSLAQAQAGNLQQAFDGWLALARDTPPDAPWFPVLQEHLQSAARDLDVDLAAVLPSDRPVPPARAPRPGPSQADIDAAQDMSPTDRQEMIRDMVARLAARLEEDPDDAEGWDRLARSYRVLGETDKAADAEARAQEARGKPAPAPTAGPSQADVRAAQEMPAGDRQEMIEGMVAGLALRLEENPDDRDGWIRLTRSYQVLGQTENALDAFANAEKAFPDDVEILQLYARAVVEQSDQGAPLPNKAFNLYRRVLESARGNPEALYFVGLGEAERGNPEEARRLWTMLLGSLEAGSEARNIVEERLRRLPTP